MGRTGHETYIGTICEAPTEKRSGKLFFDDLIECFNKERVEKIIVNNQTTILITNKGNKHISKPYNEEFDVEMGVMMCLLKMNGVTHSQIKKVLNACNGDDEKGLCHLLLNKVGYTDKDIKECIKNIDWQQNKPKKDKYEISELSTFEIGKKYRAVKKFMDNTIPPVRDSQLLNGIVFVANCENFYDIFENRIYPQHCKEVK